MTVSRGLRRKRKGPLADPVLEGLPAEVTSANAYTLNLWAAGEDRTLTKRQEEERESECTIKRLREGGCEEKVRSRESGNNKKKERK